MKKSLISSLTLAALMTSTTAFGATDWTPYLKGFQNGCEYDLGLMLIGGYDEQSDKRVAPNIPKHLRASIISSKNNRFVLKNATAFGLPLKSIAFTDDEGGDSGATTLTFGNANFDKILPQFTISDGTRTAKVGTNTYWLTATNDEGELLESYSTPYYSDEMGAEMHFGYYIKHLGESSDPYFQKSYNKLSKNFHKHQAPILEKIFSKYGTDHLRLTTYTINQTGYEVSTSGSAMGLNINKTKKQMSCYYIYFGDVAMPKYLQE